MTRRSRSRALDCPELFLDLSVVVVDHPKAAPIRGKLWLMSSFPEHREPIRDPDVLKRMGLAFDLYQVAEEMKRQNLRRQNPAATEEEIEQGVREWLRRRHGAEHGDGVGQPRPKPLEL